VLSQGTTEKSLAPDYMPVKVYFSRLIREYAGKRPDLQVTQVIEEVKNPGQVPSQKERYHFLCCLSLFSFRTLPSFMEVDCN